MRYVERKKGKKEREREGKRERERERGTKEEQEIHQLKTKERREWAKSPLNMPSYTHQLVRGQKLV